MLSNRGNSLEVSPIGTPVMLVVSPSVTRQRQFGQRTAMLLAAFHLTEIARKAGSYPEFPDFIVNERVNRGGRGSRRPVVHIDGEGKLTRYVSLSAAARAEGVDRTAVSRRPGRMAGWVDG